MPDSPAADWVPPPRLPVRPSLNRATLADVPGLPQGAAGTLANAWLTTWALAWQIAEVSEVVAGIRALGLEPPPVARGEVTPELMEAAIAWPAGLDAVLIAGPTAEGYAAATALADRFGAVLGGLIATLVQASPASRAARPDWPAERWERWAAVRRISLGGGILRGELGRRMHAGAVNLLAHNDIPVVVRLAQPVQHLVLLGAASSIESGVALDCGGSTLKGCVVVGGTPTGEMTASPAPGRVDAETVVETVAAAAATLVASVPNPDPVPVPVPVSVALATYVTDAGQPYSGQLGPYAPLGEIDTPGALRAAITRRSGREITLRIAHDGACALIGARRSDPAADAAIVLGTAIGSGVG